MKDKNELYAIFALTLALDIPLLESFLQSMFLLESNVDADEHHRISVSSESELQAALLDADISCITLTMDIVLFENLVFTRNLTLDLGGNKIACLTPNARVIDVVSGNVIITGKGSIVANGTNSAAVRIKGAMTPDTMSYSSILIDENVTLYAPNYYGLFITPNCKAAYGVEIDFRGSMIARDGFCINGNIQGRGRNIPLINIFNGARITVDENDGIAIYASGHGHWRIGAAEIIGATGLGIRTGEFELKKTSIIATGSRLPITDWSEGMTSLGAAIEIDTTHDDPIDITIRGGEYISHQSFTVIEGGLAHVASPSQTLKILKGNFSGAAGIFQGVAPQGSSNSSVVISGGNFSSNIAEYLSGSHRSEYDRSTRTYRVFDAMEGQTAPTPAQLLARAKSRLESVLTICDHYLSSSYSSQELGDLQTEVDKALASIRRAKKAAEKLLSSSRSTVDQIEHMIRRVARSNSALQKIEDELRTDILSAIAAARAIDPHDFSRYSYQILMNSAEDADILLIQKQVSLIDLYSAFCDINMNLDLLDEPEEDEDAFSQTGVIEHIAPPTPEPTSDNLEISPEPQDESINYGEEIVEAEIEPSQDFLAMTAVLGAFALAETPKIDKNLIPARENLHSLINALTILNPSDYTLDSYRKLHELILASSELLAEPDEKLSVDLLTATYNEVDSAYKQLVKKSSDPVARTIDEACQNLYSILEVVKNLTLSDYEPEYAEQFGELQVAIAKARVSLQHSTAKLPEVISAMEEIQLATTGLRGANSAAPKSPEPEELPEEITQELPKEIVKEPLEENTKELPEKTTKEPLEETSPAENYLLSPLPISAPNLDIAHTPQVVQPLAPASPATSQPHPEPFSPPATETTPAYSQQPSSRRELSSYVPPELTSEPVVHPNPLSHQPPQSPQTPPEEPPAPALDWSSLRDIISDIAALNPSDYTSESYNRLMQQLEYTRTLSSDPRLTQDIIEDIVFELNLSVLSLEHLQPEHSVYETAISNAAQPIDETSISPNNSDVAPSLLMSMMAGAYAGLATYRRSRTAAKRHK